MEPKRRPAALAAHTGRMPVRPRAKTFSALEKTANQRYKEVALAGASSRLSVSVFAENGVITI